MSADESPGDERSTEGSPEEVRGPERGDDGPRRIDSRTVHDGRIVHLSVDRVRFPDGSVGELELDRHAGASAVLPVLGSIEDDDPEILLVRQYRYAAGGHLYEVPAGMPDGPDESAEACARRELEEETGYRAGHLRPMTRIFTTPGFTDEEIDLFLATDLTAGEMRHDRDEFMEVVRLPFSRVLEMVRDGEIVDGKSLATLLYARTFLLTA